MTISSSKKKIKIERNMLSLILNLQEGESSPLKLTLCVTHFSMKLHCRNTSKHTHAYSLSPPVREAEPLEKSVRCVV